MHSFVWHAYVPFAEVSDTDCISSVCVQRPEQKNKILYINTLMMFLRSQIAREEIRAAIVLMTLFSKGTIS